MMILRFCILSGCFWLLMSACRSTELVQAPEKFKLPPILEEVSGLYIASSDSLYWMNDSGDRPVLYLTNARGDLLETILLPVKNIDWEDLTNDDKGNIYIGDFGNNNNNRRDLKIYIYQPTTEQLDSITYVYPDQTAFPPKIADRNFNMEGFFWYKDSLHLFSKNEVKYGNYYTKHYRLAAQAGQQLLDFQDSLYLEDRVVTAAAISPDQQAVALLAYDYKQFLGFFTISKASVFLFQDFPDHRFLRANQSKQKLRIGSLFHQYEALDFWDNKHILIASEGIPFYKQRAKRIRLEGRHSNSTISSNFKSTQP